MKQLTKMFWRDGTEFVASSEVTQPSSQEQVTDDSQTCSEIILCTLPVRTNFLRIFKKSARHNKLKI